MPIGANMTATPKIKIREQNKIRILIADDDGQASRRMLDFLIQSNFDCRMCHNGVEAKKILLAWKPKVLLADLMLPDGNAFELLRYCQNEPGLRTSDVAVIVLSGHNSPENVRDSYQRGARDYITRPLMYKDLLNRVVFHCRDPRTISLETKNSITAHTDTLKIADLIITQALQKLTFEEILYNMTCMAALKIKGLRCSIVYGLTGDKGIVLASNDRKDIAGLALDLRKYPEIQLVVNTGKMVVIDDLNESKALSRIKNDLKDIQFNSMIVSPIYYHHKIFGVISIRMPTEQTKMSDSDVHFIDYVAKVISLYLSTQSPETIAKYGLVGVPTVA